MAENKKLTDKDFVTTMADSDAIIGNFGGKVGQMKMEDFRNHLNDNDNQVLNDLAFYVDVNTPSALGEDRVDVGGNLHMVATMLGMRKQVLMDANGNYCPLNPNDGRYLETGEAIVDIETGAILDKWKNCDIMLIIPKYYCKVQEVNDGITTKLLPWYSPVPLPGGSEIPQMVVGVFKACDASGVMRSLPNNTADASKTGEQFWAAAQKRSKSHGLANIHFRNWLLLYMMATYSYRDSQGCKTADGTLVWGVGLDGTESSSMNEAWESQKDTKSGSCLSLGCNDGKAAITDAKGKTVHSVNVAGIENPWGLKWEFCQGLCSIGDNVICWDSNFLPAKATPTEEDFTNVPHIVLTRKTSNDKGNMMSISTDGRQGFYLVPTGAKTGINYKDYYWYAKEGQSWWFGGCSNHGSNCGLAYAPSNNVWRLSYSTYSARLAYYGDVKQVSAPELAALQS